ncbi:MAG: DEAD/DEAH box helicase [Verrucomicrobiota bacterium]
MQLRGANRLYSRGSLRQWYWRMEFGWEAQFSMDALKRGRRLYKKGSIREVSLSTDDAIMTCKIEKVENYSVIEWENGKMNIRSSTADELFAEAIAVAGLLEIEELLADEDLSLLDINTVIEVETEEKELTEEESKEKDEAREGSSRMLHLVLDTHFKGLICEAYWLTEDGVRSPALRVEDGTPNAEDGEERGRLITLAARARKSHFKYSPEFNGYLLENLHEIPFFIHKVWPTWKKAFSTEEREYVANIKENFTELKVSAKAGMTAKGGLNVQWVVNSGGSVLSEELAHQLMNGAASPLLIPEYGIVKLSAESRKTLGKWEEMVEENQGMEFQPYQLFSLFPDGAENLTLDEELRAWRDALFSEEAESTELLACLRPYQVLGVEWMRRLLSRGCHCLLADEMGLGKTVQIIALLKSQLVEGDRVLVVCPASVVPVWLSEFEKFAPEFRVSKFEGRAGEIQKGEWQVLVSSYAQLRNRIDRIEKREFAFSILDEAQFIKNPDAKVTRSCFRIKASKRIALTGTPIENRPLDIWPAFRFLMPGLLGSRSNFEAAMQGNPGAFKSRLKTQITPFMLRRTKREVAKDLPEKILIDQKCGISKLQAAEYARICSNGIQKLGNDLGSALKQNRFAALSLLTRLRQASCDPHLLPWVEADLESSGKLMMLLEKLIEVLGTGHKVVIFSQFVRFLKRVREMVEVSFPELPIFELTGSTKDRQTPVREFQECKETAAMLVSLRAAGTGITLNSADYVFLLDPWWNPAVENQAIDRVHRIGQKNTVFVYRLIAEGTVEERIQDLKREKSELFESIVQDSKSGPDQMAQQFKSLEALLVLAGSNAQSKKKG